jgi:hypothetical protein
VFELLYECAVRKTINDSSMARREDRVNVTQSFIAFRWKKFNRLWPNYRLYGVFLVLQSWFHKCVHKLIHKTILNKLKKCVATGFVSNSVNNLSN